MLTSFFTPRVLRLSPEPKEVSFSAKGIVDAEIISNFARQNPNIRILVTPTESMPNGSYGVRCLTADERRKRDAVDAELRKFATARFNMGSTEATPASPGMFPGDENPEEWTQKIFGQDKFPVYVSFRDSDCGPNLGSLVFHKDQIEGQYLDENSPILIKIKELIERISIPSSAPQAGA